MGLALSQEIVHMMGGVLEVESPEGKGCLFTLKVNLPEIALQNREIPKRESRYLGYLGERKKLLIVDDDQEIRSFLKGLLLSLGFETEEASDGEEALRKANQWNPDLILMDLVLPKISGLEVVYGLRQKALFRNTAIIAVSGNSGDFAKAQAEEMGCSDFISKPVEVDDLLKKIESHLTLEWISSEKVYEALPLLSPMVLPQREQVAQLYSLLVQGDLEELSVYLEELKKSRSHLSPFVKIAQGMVKEYQLKELFRFFKDLLGESDGT